MIGEEEMDGSVEQLLKLSPILFKPVFLSPSILFSFSPFLPCLSSLYSMLLLLSTCRLRGEGPEGGQ